MTETSVQQRAVSLTPDDMISLVGMASRAPSVHNTQPWRFRARDNAIELYADSHRMLRHVDPAGREMILSCGAAIFGLRLGMRKLGYLPQTDLLPDPGRPRLIARVRPSGRAPATRLESEMIAALPHRHTHRGPFGPGDVSSRLLADLSLDATAERAELVIVDDHGTVRQLAGLVLAAASEQAADPAIMAEERSWARLPGAAARDGIPAQAWMGTQRAGLADETRPALRAAFATPRLPQRDFGLRESQPPGAHPPVVTAVLATPGDSPVDWIHAGQALHRVLLHAATRWVFASLQSQPLESDVLRAEVRACVDMDGYPQLLLQLGRANTAPATPRRPATDTIADEGL
jgi:nitroreductase